MAAPLRVHIYRLAIGLAFLAATDRALGYSQGNAPWISNQEQARLVEGLQSKLPSGWTLTSRGLGGMPEEWQSLDSRTFQIDGKNGDRSFRIWFLPTDWIGIRRPDPRRTRGVYWEGVLSNSKYKSITVGEVAIHEAVQSTGMNTTSLVNSGFNISRDRLNEIDQRTQELVRRFCATRECVNEAAYSLIVLGVPARTLTRDCADHATGRAQEYCVDVLGYWGEPENVPLLNALVARPTITADVRGSAAFSLMRLADPSSGPALRQALQASPSPSGDDRSVISILSAIGRIRYAPAGPDILARLLTESNRFAQALLAKTLADVRYAPAAPAIERLCRTTDISSDWIIANTAQGDQDRQPEMALLRLTALWGAPSDQIRVLVLPPDKLTLTGKIPVAVLIENVGNKELPGLKSTPGMWVIDGKEFPGIDRPKWDGTMHVPVNSLDVRRVDLSPAISTPGLHSFHYRLLGATSNQVTLEFREARSAK